MKERSDCMKEEKIRKRIEKEFKEAVREGYHRKEKEFEKII